MTVEVDLSELGKLQTLLGAAGNKATTDMPRVLNKVADSVVERAKALAPVDSGALRADIGIKGRSGTSREVGSTLRQAYFQEFGTSRHPPQPWLSPAADRGIEELLKEMDDLGGLW